MKLIAKIIRIYPSQFDEKNIETISDLKKLKKIRENTAVCYFLTSFHFRFHEKHHKSFSNVF